MSVLLSRTRRRALLMQAVPRWRFHGRSLRNVYVVKVYVVKVYVVKVYVVKVYVVKVYVVKVYVGYML